MYRFSVIIVAAVGTITIAGEDVRAAEADKVIDGYNCMLIDYNALNVTEEEAFNGTGLQPVFAGPTEGSRKLGTTGTIGYVDWPLNEVNGFVRMLRPNGEHAWIHENALKPLGHASASVVTCRLSQNAKGRIQYTPLELPPAAR